MQSYFGIRQSNRRQHKMECLQSNFLLILIATTLPIISATSEPCIISHVYSPRIRYEILSSFHLRRSESGANTLDLSRHKRSISSIYAKQSKSCINPSSSCFCICVNAEAQRHLGMLSETRIDLYEICRTSSFKHAAKRTPKLSRCIELQ
jgi:hypothetical protein